MASRTSWPLTSGGFLLPFDEASSLVRWQSFQRRRLTNDLSDTDKLAGKQITELLQQMKDRLDNALRH
jgi:hypothetical protein